MFVYRLVLASMLLALVTVNAFGAKRYEIRAGKAGSLGVMDGKVVVSKEKQFDRLWIVEKSDKESGSFIRTVGGGGPTQYLTADNDGNGFVKEQPGEGSYWGIRLPSRGDAQNTWISNADLNPHPRSLDVKLTEPIKDDQGKVIAYPIKLGPPPKDGKYVSEDTRFQVMLISP